MSENVVSLRQVQLMEKEILVKFADYCSQNNLKYTLVGGTLLGAVRHSGFIPWDDDIDVAMPRPDYERFLQLSKEKKISKGLKVISGDYDDSFSLPFAKIIDENISISEKCRNHDAGSNNLWIDVMPFDGLGNDLEGAKKSLKKATFYHKAIGRASSVSWTLREGEYGVSGYFKCMYRQIFRLVGYNYYKKKLIKLAKKNDFDKSDYIAIVVWGQYGYGEIIKRKKFLNLDLVEFEGKLFQRMGTWEDYLAGVYGDYMKLPPIEKRVCPHNFQIVIK